VIPGIWQCPRRVGFLFPHQCQRLTPVGCPDCHNGSIEDPYTNRTDRRGYDHDNFDHYNSNEVGSWAGSDDPDEATFGGGDSGGAGASMEFSEADGESLTASDRDFEDDLSAS
jgi:hypothetical protein